MCLGPSALACRQSGVASGVFVDINETVIYVRSIGTLAIVYCVPDTRKRHLFLVSYMVVNTKDIVRTPRHILSLNCLSYAVIFIQCNSFMLLNQHGDLDT